MSDSTSKVFFTLGLLLILASLSGGLWLPGDTGTKASLSFLLGMAGGGFSMLWFIDRRL